MTQQAESADTSRLADAYVDDLVAHQADSSFDWGAWLNDDVLEVVVMGERSLNGTDFAGVGFRLLLAYGGPTVTLTFRETSGDWAALDVHWGGERSSRQVQIPALIELLEELA